LWNLLHDVIDLGVTPQSVLRTASSPKGEPITNKPPLKREGNRRQAVEGFRGHSTTRPIIPLIQTTSYLHKRTDRLSSLCVLIVEMWLFPNIFKLFLDTHSAIWYTKFKAIPHKDCATDASSNFSSDETKSGVNT